MYLAKDRGKSTIAVYEPQLHAEALDRLALRDDLHDAIRNGELTLHFQPTVELGPGRLAGFEALVRWIHPERGLLSPLEFIPLAEQTGLIHALGSWVLRTACAAAVELGDAVDNEPAADDRGQRDGAAAVASRLRQRGHRRLWPRPGWPRRGSPLEITESVLMRDLDAVDRPAGGAARARRPDRDRRLRHRLQLARLPAPAAPRHPQGRQGVRRPDHRRRARRGPDRGDPGDEHGHGSGHRRRRRRGAGSGRLADPGELPLRPGLLLVAAGAVGRGSAARPRHADGRWAAPAPALI